MPVCVCAWVAPVCASGVSHPAPLQEDEDGKEDLERELSFQTDHAATKKGAGGGTKTLAQRLSQSLRDPLRSKDYLGTVDKGEFTIDCHHHSKVIVFKNRKGYLSPNAMENLTGPHFFHTCCLPRCPLRTVCRSLLVIALASGVFSPLLRTCPSKPCTSAVLADRKVRWIQCACRMIKTYADAGCSGAELIQVSDTNWYERFSILKGGEEGFCAGLLPLQANKDTSLHRDLDMDNQALQYRLNWLIGLFDLLCSSSVLPLTPAH